MNGNQQIFLHVLVSLITDDEPCLTDVVCETKLRRYIVSRFSDQKFGFLRSFRRPFGSGRFLF